MAYPDAMTETNTTAKDTIGKWTRALRLLHLRAQTEIDYTTVVQEVREDGALSGRYQFMTLMSCAIATLGLLLSSPAVVIGAMLISPLMGPIVQLGMSLCILDLRAMRSSLISIGVGVGLVLIASAGIVALSPLTQATPEILARTQPNLFDLLVAIFSGLAGGVSRRRAIPRQAVSRFADNGDAAGHEAATDPLCRWFVCH